MAEVLVRAEFAAMVLSLSVATDDVVAADQELLVLESMKTEIPVAAPRAGRVTAVHVSEGDTIQDRQLLVVLEA
jgi:acetyl-CoA carboxylase biotin carboxyl carrier protein